MSNDLISRKALMECAEYDANFNLVIPYNKVANAQTAYDVDAVCKELEKLTKDECTLHECGIRSERCNVCMARKAIDIVRNGGMKG